MMRVMTGKRSCEGYEKHDFIPKHSREEGTQGKVFSTDVMVPAKICILFSICVNEQNRPAPSLRIDSNH